MNQLTFETSQLLTSGGAAALFLLDMTLKATAIILAAIALSFVLRRASAATRHLLWSTSLLALLALPLLAYTLPDWRVAVLPESFSASEVTSIVREPQTIAHGESAVRPAATTKPMALAQEEKGAATVQPLRKAEAIASASPKSFHWSRWILLMWLAGFLISIGRLTLGIGKVWRLSRAANEITDATWIALCHDIGRQLDLPRRVALLKSSRIAMPQTWGTLNPTILLPAEAADWSIERRRVVLMHELAHVKRKDWLTQVMAQTACSFYWFNPLVWMAARRLRIERELACDDQVLEKGTKASDYADLLLDIARTLHSGTCSSLTAVAMARQSQLEGRLLAILNPSLNRKGLNRLKASILVVALALVILPLASLRPTAQAKASQRAELTSSTVAENLDNQGQANLDDDVASASITSAKSKPKGPVDEAGEEQPKEDTNDEQKQAEPAQQDQHASDQTHGTAVQALLEALKDSDPQVRKQAAWGLGINGGEGATDSLISSLKDEDPEVRAQAAWSLGMKGDSRAAEPLRAALKDDDARVRAQAAWSLGMKHDSRAVVNLIDALKDSSARVRSQAAWSLGMIGNGESIDALIAALKDPSSLVRAQAAWALGMKRAQRAIEPLNEATKDENPQVRQNASRALDMILIKMDVNIKLKIDNRIVIRSE